MTILASAWAMRRERVTEDARSADQSNDTPSRDGDAYDKLFERVISVDERVVRLRKRPQHPSAANEYDSPPSGCRGGGRLDSEDFPVLYASQDIEVRVHECRVTVEDDLFMATLAPTRPIRCLDLTAVLEEDGCTEFERLDMAVHMLFLVNPTPTASAER